MTGPNNFIDINPENEENQFKNHSHEERNATNISVADSYSTRLMTCHPSLELACSDSIPKITYSL